MLTKYTKHILAESMIELAQTMPVNKITIQDIVSNCGAGRATFYNHFKDKQELIGWIYKKDADRILLIFNSGTSLKECVKKIYIMFWENKQFYTKVARLEGQNSFIDTLFTHTYDYYCGSIIKRFGQEELTDRLLYTIRFNCYGAVNMCHEWLTSGMAMSPEEFADQLLHNMPNDLKKYFDSIK